MCESQKVGLKVGGARGVAVDRLTTLTLSPDGRPVPAALCVKGGNSKAKIGRMGHIPWGTAMAPREEYISTFALYSGCHNFANSSLQPVGGGLDLCANPSRELAASYAAFAAILGDGTVMTWGDADYGGVSETVEEGPGLFQKQLQLRVKAIEGCGRQSSQHKTPANEMHSA